MSSSQSENDARRFHPARLRRLRRGKSQLREVVAFWVDRAERLEANLPNRPTPVVVARGILHPYYTLGKQIRNEVDRG